MTLKSEFTKGLLALSSLTLLGLAACDRPANPTGANNAKSPAPSTPPSAQTTPAPSAQTSPSTEAAKAGTAVDDSAITAAVRAGIQAEPELKTQKIDVATHEGRVTLTGSADSAENAKKAEQVASNVNGVKGVENRLTVEKS